MRVHLRGTIGAMETSRRSQGASGYPRSVRSPRGEARRAELLAAVASDLKANGLADFSLRRAARAAGTTHKVLLYHFNGAEELLGEAIASLREGRIANALSAAAAHDTLGERVQAMWPVLMEDATGLRVIDQAIGLAMYDAIGQRDYPMLQGGFAAPAPVMAVPDVVVNDGSGVAPPVVAPEPSPSD